MRVDRNRFLLLTTAIASGACHSEPAAQAPIRVADPMHPPSATVSTTPLPEPTSPTEIEDEPEPQNGAGDEPPAVDVAEEGAERLRVGLEPRHGPSALVAECQRLRPPQAPHCEGFHWTQTLCEAFDRSLQREVAQAAVACLVGHSSRPTICNPDTREDCFARAVNTAMAGRQDRGQCASAVSHCTRGGHGSKTLTKTTCRRAVAAVRPAFRAEMITCIAESCGIRECVYVLEP